MNNRWDHIWTTHKSFYCTSKKQQLCGREVICSTYDTKQAITKQPKWAFRKHHICFLFRETATRWNKFQKLQKDFSTNFKNVLVKRPFFREIIKNSWLGVSLSQLQRELLCSYQTEMTFILQYFHLQRTEKHLIPFETLFGPSLHFSDSSSAPTSFFFAPSPRTRVEILNLRFTLTCTNLHVLHCGVSQDQALVPKWGLIITHSIASAKEQNAKSSDKKFVQQTAMIKKGQSYISENTLSLFKKHFPSLHRERLYVYIESSVPGRVRWLDVMTVNCNGSWVLLWSKSLSPVELSVVVKVVHARKKTHSWYIKWLKPLPSSGTTTLSATMVLLRSTMLTKRPTEMGSRSW